jgi:hypothetical protein
MTKMSSCIVFPTDFNIARRFDTIRVLALLSVLMIANFPRFITIGWGSMLYQPRVFSLTWDTGHVLAMIVALNCTASHLPAASPNP